MRLHLYSRSIYANGGVTPSLSLPELQDDLLSLALVEREVFVLVA